jgi:hypothetical protein
MSTQDTYGRTHIGPESYSESTNLPPIDQLEGMEVRDASGDKIGKVDDSYTDTGAPTCATSPSRPAGSAPSAT